MFSTFYSNDILTIFFFNFRIRYRLLLTISVYSWLAAPLIAFNAVLQNIFPLALPQVNSYFNIKFLSNFSYFFLSITRRLIFACPSLVAFGFIYTCMELAVVLV